MSNLANVMEDYLKKLLTLSAYGYIEIKRKELATKFSCVPSQVNYVLETRFTMEKGFLVESRRGGKGFVSIKKLNFPAQKLLSILMPEIQGGRINSEKAKMLLQKIYEEKYISFRELKLMETVLDTLNFLDEESQQARLRSLLLKNMLIVLTGHVYFG
jgi:transcriptional regulator CtsR